MPLYIADYLRKTMHLTRDQHGGYMLLLMACWDRGGRLPNDPGQLAGIARATPAEWRKLAPVLLPFFDIEGDCLVQGRVIEEHEKAARLSETRREAGSRGGRPRKETGDKQKPNGFADENQNGSQNETPAGVRSSPSPSPEYSVPDGTVSDGVGKPDLDRLWSLASSQSKARSSRKDLERALKAAIRRGHNVADITAGVGAYFSSREATKDGGEYAKGIHRLIENDRWQEFAPATGGLFEVPSSPFLSPSPERQRIWMQDYVGGGEWKVHDRGPRPGDPGCRVDAAIQREFMLETGRAA